MITDADPETGQNILNLVEKSFLYKDVKPHLTPVHVRLVNNKRLERLYTQKKLELRIENSNKELTDRYGFIYKDSSMVLNLCVEGLRCDQDQEEVLGPLNWGVLLQKHADLCLLQAVEAGCKNPSIIIFKYVTGKPRPVRSVGKYGEVLPSVEPQKEYDSHVSSLDVSPSCAIKTNINRGQIYLYDRMPNAFRLFPRQVMPIACVDYVHQSPSSYVSPPPVSSVVKTNGSGSKTPNMPGLASQDHGSITGQKDLLGQDTKEREVHMTTRVDPRIASNFITNCQFFKKRKERMRVIRKYIPPKITTLCEKKAQRCLTLSERFAYLAKGCDVSDNRDSECMEMSPLRLSYTEAETQTAPVQTDCFSVQATETMIVNETGSWILPDEEQQPTVMGSEMQPTVNEDMPDLTMENSMDNLSLKQKSDSEENLKTSYSSETAEIQCDPDTSSQVCSDRKLLDQLKAASDKISSPEEKNIIEQAMKGLLQRVEKQSSVGEQPVTISPDSSSDCVMITPPECKPDLPNSALRAVHSSKNNRKSNSLKKTKKVKSDIESIGFKVQPIQNVISPQYKRTDKVASTQMSRADKNVGNGKKTKPETRGKFHGRTLLCGAEVPARKIPLEPLYLTKPKTSNGKLQVRPEDPRILQTDAEGPDIVGKSASGNMSGDNPDFPLLTITPVTIVNEEAEESVSGSAQMNIRDEHQSKEKPKVSTQEKDAAEPKPKTVSGNDSNHRGQDTATQAQLETCSKRPGAFSMLNMLQTTFTSPQSSVHNVSDSTPSTDNKATDERNTERGEQGVYSVENVEIYDGELSAIATPNTVTLDGLKDRILNEDMELSPVYTSSTLMEEKERKTAKAVKSACAPKSQIEKKIFISLTKVDNPTISKDKSKVANSSRKRGTSQVSNNSKDPDSKQKSRKSTSPSRKKHPQPSYKRSRSSAEDRSRSRSQQREKKHRHSLSPRSDGHRKLKAQKDDTASETPRGRSIIRSSSFVKTSGKLTVKTTYNNSRSQRDPSQSRSPSRSSARSLSHRSGGHKSENERSFRGTYGESFSQQDRTVQLKSRSPDNRCAKKYSYHEESSRDFHCSDSRDSYYCDSKDAYSSDSRDSYYSDSKDLYCSNSIEKHHSDSRDIYGSDSRDSFHSGSMDIFCSDSRDSLYSDHRDFSHCLDSRDSHFSDSRDSFHANTVDGWSSRKYSERSRKEKDKPYTCVTDDSRDNERRNRKTVPESTYGNWGYSWRERDDLRD